jgi:hypothetical protein
MSIDLDLHAAPEPKLALATIAGPTPAFPDFDHVEQLLAELREIARLLAEGAEGPVDPARIRKAGAGTAEALHFMLKAQDRLAGPHDIFTEYFAIALQGWLDHDLGVE